MRWALAILLFGALVTIPAPLEARCAMAAGERLRLLLPSGHVSPGGVLLFVREPVYQAHGTMTFPVAQLTLRQSACQRHCTHRAPLRALALDLYALDVAPNLAEATYTVVETRSSFVIAAGSVAAVPTSAPVLAPAPMGTMMVGTGATQPTIELASASPAGALGLLTHWRATTWFTLLTAGQTGSAPIGPRRCTPDIAGREAMAVGDRVDVTFVGEGGGLSPSTTFTSTTDIAGAPVSH